MDANVQMEWTQASTVSGDAEFLQGCTFPVSETAGHLDGNKHLSGHREPVFSVLEKE